MDSMHLSHYYSVLNVKKRQPQIKILKQFNVVHQISHTSVRNLTLLPATNLGFFMDRRVKGIVCGVSSVETRYPFSCFFEFVFTEIAYNVLSLN